MAALLVLGTGCGKKKEREAAEALRKEQARQQAIYDDNQATLGASCADWVGYYLSTKGLAGGEMQVYVYAKGQDLDYWYQDTIREGTVTLPRIVAPKFPPANAMMVNGCKIERSGAPREKYLLEASAVPNPAPVPLVLDLNDSRLLLGGYIIGWDLGWGWFFFDVPGTVDDLGWLADRRDEFLFAEGKAPALRVEVRSYDGNVKGSLKERFLVMPDKSFARH